MSGALQQSIAALRGRFLQSGSRRILRKEIGWWPAIHVSAQNVVTVSAGYFPPKAWAHAKAAGVTIALLTGFLIFSSEYDHNYHQPWPAAVQALKSGLITGVVVGAFVYLCARRHVDVRFSGGGIKVRRSSIQPAAEREFNVILHEKARKEDLDEQDRLRRGKGPLPRHFRDASQVVILHGPGKMHRVTVAEIANDPHQHAGNKLRAALVLTDRMDDSTRQDTNAPRSRVRDDLL